MNKKSLIVGIGLVVCLALALATARYLVRQQELAMQTREEWIGELYKSNPDDPQLITLLPERWQSLRSNPAGAETASTEIEAVLSKSKDEKLAAEALYCKALFSLLSMTPTSEPRDVLAKIDAFAKRYPRDVRAADLLVNVSSRMTDPKAREVVFERIKKDYPETAAAKKVAAARLAAGGANPNLGRIGKPFELEFTEATKGTQITMASLKGKVVVIDFWATWCGPCVKEMPNMKKLYAEYRDKGVEFIGVSLDQPKEQGGLDKLKDYVAKNGVEWPQYYQGNYWQSEFSSSWGINSIPCVFLVDADGNLASINARGKLEQLLPEYLEKARAKSGSNKTASLR